MHDDALMALVYFPHGKTVLTGRSWDDDLVQDVDGLLEQGECPNGWLELETPDARLICLFHQSRPHISGLVEEDAFAWVPLIDFPIRAGQLEGAVCSVHQSDPVQVLLLAVHFRNRPALQAPTDLIELAYVLKALADKGRDAALSLERDGVRTLLFLQKGQPARVYFGNPAQDPGSGSVAERFVSHAFDPEAPVGRLEVFHHLAIEPDPDAGRPLGELADEAKPPPPTNIVVRLGGRVVLQRPFIPPELLVGRDHKCGLILDNLSVSRRHARLSWERGQFVIEDLGSANGTSVNGQRIERKEIKFEDRITTGKFDLSLVEPPDISHPDATVLMLPKAADDSPLHLLGEDGSIALGEETTLGKAQGVDVRLRGLLIKPVHARIKSEGNGIYRLFSPGGPVLLNGQKIQSAFVHEGDELVIGRNRFRFVAQPGQEG
ncbi:MAG: FHA domain-containing protein [Deltaproteobacteria bacterium]|nr:FHA domain-containing protein [Deltaproteobacteria bacterium]